MKQFKQDTISIIKENSEDLKFITRINDEMVKKAQSTIKLNPSSSIELFQILASINLLNAAIKRKEYKKHLSYRDIKGNASRLIRYLIGQGLCKFDTRIFISEDDKCAYIDCFDFQFSFHHIPINRQLEDFMKSSRNKTLSWKGVRLQRVAGEVFEIAMGLPT